MAMHAIKHWRLSEAVSSGMNVFWHFSAKQSAFASQLRFGELTHLAASVPHFLRIIVG